MALSSNNQVNDFLMGIQSLSAERYEIVEAIRQLFLSAHADLSEGIKYGGLVFTLDEQLLGGIFLYKNHLSIEFSHGAEFEDAEGLLEGSGKFRRHLKITSLDDIQQKRAGDFIKQAVTL